MRLILADAIAFAIYFPISRMFPIAKIPLVRALALATSNLLLALTYRMVYRYVYKCIDRSSKFGKFVIKLVRILGGASIDIQVQEGPEKIRIAIVGAGSVGVGLSEELLSNPKASYLPKCFIDIDKEKVGKIIHDIPVLLESDETPNTLKTFDVQEVVFALPQLSTLQKKSLYERYRKEGFKIKTYDYPDVQSAEEGRRHLREFDVEELLFRKPIVVTDDDTARYYDNKVVLITGGGGSIGSELCRQVATMRPRKIIVLDVYENGAYDVQQELRIKYGKSLDLQVEICSICNKDALDKVFARYRPNIVVMAAAHKHVPLMEHNVVEAVENNILGTINTVEVSEKYGVDRVMMVSTDKAVNPTNVMGATKRFCEMVVMSKSAKHGHTTYSTTRFGNVLGSAGSVIPLFKKQISSGGPITLTDKRIIRYFMTIPEASQLILCSGAMARNGELFVLDMGNPVKILNLAEDMIRLSGFTPYIDIDIVETGLRPGEKLYEELLMKSETLSKTKNKLIFIEKDQPLDEDELNRRIDVLTEALKTNDDEIVKNALKQAVETYVDNDVINSKVQEEIKQENN